MTLCLIRDPLHPTLCCGKACGHGGIHVYDTPAPWLKQTDGLK